MNSSIACKSWIRIGLICSYGYVQTGSCVTLLDLEYCLIYSGSYFVSEHLLICYYQSSINFCLKHCFQSQSSCSPLVAYTFVQVFSLNCDS